MIIKHNFALYKNSYIHIGPVIKKMYFIENIDDFNGLDDFKIIGNMSNILFTSNSNNMNLVKLSGDFNKMEINYKKDTIKVGAGTRMVDLINYLMKNNYGGFEELWGIPGTIGGMLYMNASSFGKSISDNLIEIQTLNKGLIPKKNIIFDYRYSDISDTILYAIFKIYKMNQTDIINKLNIYIEKRLNNQPKAPSLGSVFKNPSDKIKAWELIQNAGLCGYCINDICVSLKHCNFFVNKGNGTADDFIQLLEHVKNKVFEETGIKLENEIEIL